LTPDASARAIRGRMHLRRDAFPAAGHEPGESGTRRRTVKKVWIVLAAAAAFAAPAFP